MKKALFLIICFLGMWSASKALDASVSYATFRASDKSYVEISIFVVGSTVNFQRLDSLQMQASVEVIILFKRGEEIFKFDKFQLNSPIAPQPIDFMDIKRYGLEDGSYTLEVSIRDLTMADNAKTFTTSLEMQYSGQALLQSDLQLMSSIEPSEETANPFFKNGFILKPLPFSFYGNTATKLIFYNEIYNADKAIGEDFMISYSIEAVDGKGEGETVLIGHKRRKATPVDVLLLQMDIGQLRSGNYQLVVDLRNRQNELLSRRTVPFQRSNFFLDMSEETMASVSWEQEFVGKLQEEEVIYSLKTLIPIVDGFEAEFLDILIREGKPANQRLYLFNYWARRDPNQPAQAYEQYMEVARAVDQMFKNGFGYGFESDRGYVYLKYGRPDDIVTEWNEPSAPPYEIWSYNYVPSTRQNNARFIFYNPTLAGDDFRLLHSNVRGELQNPQWEIELYRRAPNEIEGSDYFQGTQMQDNFGRQARKRFEDF